MGGVLQAGFAQGVAGRERVDANAVVAELAADGAGKCRDRALGRHVMREIGNPTCHRARTDVDDLAYLRAIMCGTTCLTMRNGPRMLIAMTRSHSSTSI